MDRGCVVAGLSCDWRCVSQSARVEDEFTWMKQTLFPGISMEGRLDAASTSQPLAFISFHGIQCIIHLLPVVLCRLECLGVSRWSRET